MDRRATILAAAAEAFYDKGFHGTGMDELGRRAGLTGPSLYRHFSGKDEILAVLLNEAMDELMPALAPQHADPAADLDRALRHHIGFALEHVHLVSIYQREVRALAAPFRGPFDARRAQYTRQWEALLARCYPGARQPAVAAAAQACLGMVFSVSFWPARSRQPGLAAGLIRDLLWHGLGTLGRS